MSTDLRGCDLVVEFLKETKANWGDKVVEKLVNQISETHHCAPSDLRISDAEANQLINQLYWMANEEELKAATLPMTSR